MSKSFFHLCLLSFLITACQPIPIPPENYYNIIPLPQSLSPQEGQFILDDQVAIVLNGGEEDLTRVLNHFVAEIAKTTGIQLKEGSGDREISFVINQDISGQDAYQLSIDQNRVLASAATPEGLFYAAQTLEQLLPLQQEDNPQQTWFFPALELKDAARFSYRGMHLDVARHFFPVETVKRLIDQIADHKMNYFHWHLTEDQGWRIEIKQYPKLTEVGGYRNGTLVGHYNDQPHQFDGKRYGGFYTQEEIKEVVAYAADRYITVIPEIEMPGHAQAALAAYPELGCEDTAYEVWQKWGVSENVFCPKEETFTFLENVLDEVVELFPGPYVHIGGDECPKTKWKESDFCQDLMRREGLKDEFELQSYFIRRIEKHLNSKGKKIIGWDEILEGGIAPNATIMSWRGMEGGIEAANAQHDVIMTPTSHCYLDYYQSDHPDEPLAIGGFLPLSKVYALNPIPEELDEETRKYILGAQVNVWTEYIPTEEKLEYMIFPRLSALSEVVWSKEERDFTDFVGRLVPHLQRLKQKGITAANHLYEIKPSFSKEAGKLRVSLTTLAPDAKIYYSLDGSEPSPQSKLYDGPIPIGESIIIKAQAFLAGQKIGRAWSQEIDWHKAVGKSITLEYQPHPKYASGGRQAVINGIKGSNERYGDQEWLGFSDKDFEAIIDLGENQEIAKVELRFFKGEGQWIYLPRKVILSASSGGEDYLPLTQADQIEGDSKVVGLSLSFKPTIARYLKIEAKNYGIIPAGRQGEGHGAWLFVDEVSVY